MNETLRQQFISCGKDKCRACAGGQKGHGPYWYAFWKEGGKTRSRYLGKNPPGFPPPAPTKAGVYIEIGGRYLPITGAKQRALARAEMARASIVSTPELYADRRSVEPNGGVFQREPGRSYVTGERAAKLHKTGAGARPSHPKGIRRRAAAERAARSPRRS